jgi:hypothetical protein
MGDRVEGGSGGGNISRRRSCCRSRGRHGRRSCRRQLSLVMIVPYLINGPIIPP